MASKRILKELKDLQKDPPTSCSADQEICAKLQSNLASAYKDSGHVDAAIKSYKQALLHHQNL